MSILAALIRKGAANGDDVARFMRAGGRNADELAEILSRRGSAGYDDYIKSLPDDLQDAARSYLAPLRRNAEAIQNMETAIRNGDNVNVNELAESLGRSADEIEDMVTTFRSTLDDTAASADKLDDALAAARRSAGQSDELGENAARQAAGEGDNVVRQTADEGAEAAARTSGGLTSRVRSLFTRKKILAATALGGTVYALNQMGILGDADEGPDMPLGESEIDRAFRQATEAVPAFISWVNANRVAINERINNLTAPDGTPLPDEIKQALLIPADLPAGDKLNEPNLARAYVSVMAIKDDPLVQTAPATFMNIQKVDGLMLAYNAMYDTLGNDAQLPDAPREAMTAFGALNLRATIKQIDEAGMLGDLPDFELKTDPFNLRNPAFLASYTAASVRAEEAGRQILSGILADDAVSADIKTAISNAGGMGAQIEIAINSGILNEQDALKLRATHAILLAEANLDPASLNQLANDRAAILAGPDAPTPTNQNEETTLTMEEIVALFTPDIRYATLAVERAFENREDYAPGSDNWEADQFLDHKTRHEINDIVTTAFSSYGSDFYGDDISRVIVAPDGEGGERYFAFNEEGYIFEVEIEGGRVEKDHAYADDPAFPVTARVLDGGKVTYKEGPAVGNISQGIHVRDENGYINSVHFASAAFMGWVFESMEQEERDRNTRIEGFFSSISESQTPSLEEELRLELQNRNLTEDQFKGSDLFRRIKEAKGDDDATNEFVTQLFALDLNRFSHGADTLGLVEGVGESSAIYNLLRTLSGSRVNEGHQALRDQTPFARDNILSRNGYEILKQMRHGERVALAILEDGRQDEFGARQRAALHKEFADENGAVPQSISREQVYAFVRKQFDLRAIAQLGDLRLEAEHLASMSEADKERFGEMLGQDLTEDMIAAMSVTAQSALIRNNADILDRVSMAMAEGEFNPDDRDVRLVFKAFERPELDNDTIRHLIDTQRAAGRIPTAEYALHYLTKNQLADITGIANFSDPNAYSLEAQKEILNELLRNPTPALLANDNYERLTMNFYEPFLANYTWFRNGEVEDNSMNTWNGRYGEPGQDQLMHMFMSYNMLHLEKQFPGGAHRVFYEGGSRSQDFNLTYDEVRTKLAEIDARDGTNHVAQLDAGIAGLHRPSMYMYMMEMRLHHYRDLRNNHYIPGLKDRQIAPEFNRAIGEPPITPAQPDGPESPDGSDVVVANAPGEQLDETELSNLGVLPSSVMMMTRMRPDGTGRGTITTSTDLALRGGTDIIVYEGRDALVIPPELADPTARRDVLRARQYQRIVAEGSGATEGEQTIARRRLDRVMEKYNLTENQITQYGDQFEAENRAQAAAESRARAQAEAEGRASTETGRPNPTGDGTATPRTTGQGDIRINAADITPSDSRALILYEGGPLVPTDDGSRAIVLSETGDRFPALIEGDVPSSSHIPWGKTVSGGAAVFSTALAFSDTDEAHKVTTRLGAAAIDIGLAADDIAYNSRFFGGNTRFLGMQGGKVLASGGVAIVVTTGAEIGIAMYNKDGQAAGAASVVGGAALTGMGVGAVMTSWLGPGAVIGGAVGAVVGTVGGVALVAYSEVEDPLGRFYNDIVYNGSWFNEGMITKTENLLDTVADYKTRIAQGNVSQAELAEYREVLEELEDHLMDLRKAEITLANLAAPSFAAVDADGDGNITEAEMNADDSADHKNIQLWITNRRLQEQLAAARTDLETAYDATRHGQLDAILDGATSARDIENRLQGDFAYVARDIDNTWQIGGWWNNQDDWERRLSDVREKLTFHTEAGNVLRINHLTHEELEATQREVHNIREEIEERIQNLLYDASKGDLSTEEFRELKKLRDDLRTADELEATLWSQSGSLGGRALEKQEVTQMDRARAALDACRTSDGRVNRDALETYLNRAENADIVKGRDEYNWLWLTTAGVEKLARRVNEHDMTDGQLDGMSEERLTEKFESLQDVEEDLDARIYNLMIQAAEGNLSRSEAQELDKALEAQKQLQEVKAEYTEQFAENRGDVTGQDSRGLTPGAGGPVPGMVTRH